MTLEQRRDGERKGDDPQTSDEPDQSSTAYEPLPTTKLTEHDEEESD